MSSTKVTKSELNDLKTKFSIRHFVADLPRLLNEAFGKIVNCITYFYDPDEEVIKANKAEITYIDATTIVAQNLKFKSENGQIYTLDQLADSVIALQGHTIEVLDIPRKWPLYSDYYMNRPQNPSDGCKVLISTGVETYSSSNHTWTSHTVDDGVIYLVASNMHIYQFDQGQGWMDLGTYPNND